jgi:hypothetical protein
MGRPLPSRFFGNRNTGSSSTDADNGLSGEGVESISNGTVGAIQVNNTYQSFPELNVAAPNLPTGVNATTAVTWEIATIVVSSGGTGYTNNQTGVAVTTLTGLYVQANVVPVLTLNTNGSNAVTAVNITGSNRGEFTDVDGTGITTWGVVGAGGSNAQVTVTFRVKSIAVTEKGSGYTATPSLSWSQVNGGTMPSAQTVTMTTPDGTVTDASGYNFATIKVTAKTTSGGSALAGDIVSQKGSRRYRVATTDGTAVCSLVAATPSSVNQMSLIATDYSGNLYYVTKLTRHRVLLTQHTGSTHEFATGSSAAWTLDTLVAGDTGVTVQLANN